MYSAWKEVSVALSHSELTTVGKVNNKHAKGGWKSNMENTIADNALSNRSGAVIIGLLGKREHIVIVTPVEQPALQLSKQKQELPSFLWGRREYIGLVKLQGRLSSGLNVTWQLIFDSFDLLFIF